MNIETTRPWGVHLRTSNEEGKEEEVKFDVLHTKYYFGRFCFQSAVPIEFIAAKKVTAVACGTNHSLLITEDTNQVLCYGSNEKGGRMENFFFNNHF